MGFFAISPISQPRKRQRPTRDGRFPERAIRIETSLLCLLSGEDTSPPVSAFGLALATGEHFTLFLHPRCGVRIGQRLKAGLRLLGELSADNRHIRLLYLDREGEIR